MLYLSNAPLTHYGLLTDFFSDLGNSMENSRRLSCSIMFSLPKHWINTKEKKKEKNNDLTFRG